MRAQIMPGFFAVVYEMATGRRAFRGSRGMAPIAALRIFFFDNIVKRHNEYFVCMNKSEPDWPLPYRLLFPETKHQLSAEIRIVPGSKSPTDCRPAIGPILRSILPASVCRRCASRCPACPLKVLHR